MRRECRRSVRGPPRPPRQNRDTRRGGADLLEDATRETGEGGTGVVGIITTGGTTTAGSVTRRPGGRVRWSIDEVVEEVEIAGASEGEEVAIGDSEEKVQVEEEISGGDGAEEVGVQRQFGEAAERKDAREEGEVARQESKSRGGSEATDGAEAQPVVEHQERTKSTKVTLTETKIRVQKPFEVSSEKGGGERKGEVADAEEESGEEAEQLGFRLGEEEENPGEEEGGEVAQVEEAAAGGEAAVVERRRALRRRQRKRRGGRGQRAADAEAAEVGPGGQS
jgi:hypothetical protein